MIARAKAQDSRFRESMVGEAGRSSQNSMTTHWPLCHFLFNRLHEIDGVLREKYHKMVVVGKTRYNIGGTDEGTEREQAQIGKGAGANCRHE